MKIKSKLMVAIGLCIGSFGILADEQNFDDRDFQLASGVGVHYGGLLGLQFSSVSDDDKFYAALALLGASIGYDRVVDEAKLHALGVSGGRLDGIFDRKNFLSLNYSYHPTGFSDRGWQAGFSILYTKEIENWTLFSSEENKHDSSVDLTISVGYKF